MSADSIRQSREIELHIVDLDYDYRQVVEHGETLAAAFADKGYDPDAVSALASTGKLAGELIGRHYLGDAQINSGGYGEDGSLAEKAQVITRHAAARMGRRQADYTGTDLENRIIVQHNYGNSGGPRLRDLRKNGAQRVFRSELASVADGDSSLDLEDVPIAVIGAGAAGVLSARAFTGAGFRDVTVFDRRGVAGGIWNQDNVRDGSKNNPFDIRYDNVQAGSAAQLDNPRGSGRSIQNFIRSLADGEETSLYGYNSGEKHLRIEQAVVTGVEPADLDHVLHIKRGTETITQNYPIVVYAPGIGRPLPLMHRPHMSTDATRQEAGIRWQQQLSDEKLRALEGKRLVFIGLGNSTAEMVDQLQQYTTRTGRQIDYRIITHYSQEQLRYPDRGFGDQKKIFRDPSVPELTSLAGDLRHINDMYGRAFREGKIVGDVRKWNVEGKRIVVEDNDGVSTTIPMDGIYTLTGYGQDPSTLDKMAINCTDQYYGTGAFDYDGEVQSQPGVPGRERLYPGYFAIGPIMKNKFNPNAIVIPGIQGQLPNLITSAVFRATEYALAHPDEMARRREARLAREKTLKYLPTDATAEDSGLDLLRRHYFDLISRDDAPHIGLESQILGITRIIETPSESYTQYRIIPPIQESEE